jgi:cell division protein FtsQ
VQQVTQGNVRLPRGIQAIIAAEDAARAPVRPVRLKPLSGDRMWTTAASLLLTAAVGYGLWTGGYVEKTYADLSTRAARLTVEAGFGLQRLTVEGQRRTADADIVKALEMDSELSLFGYDTSAARERLEKLPWVKQAQVMRLLPSTVHVALVEREPYAVWQFEGKTHLIDDTGAVVQEADRREHLNLPFVVGKGAERLARAFMTQVAEHPSIARQSYAAVRVAERRWTLKLVSGADVLLPEGDEAEALKALAELDREHGVLTKPYKRIDFRLDDRITIRPTVKPSEDALVVKTPNKSAPGGPSRDT